MVQISTPNRGMPPPVRRILSNYFDLLLSKVTRFLDCLWKLPQIRTSNFQHLECMVGSII